MGKKILLVLGGLIGILAIVVATRPDAYHVERSIEVAAPPETVFAFVDDFRAWVQWSPWEKRDPNMKKTFSPVTKGTGATYAWEGNKDVGKGRMTIVDSRPRARVATRLEFLEPFQSVAESAFDFRSPGSQPTVVTWSMEGKQNFVGKAFSLVMDMDKMIGKDFDEGLSSLKRLAEARAQADNAEAEKAKAAAGSAPAAAAALGGH